MLWLIQISSVTWFSRTQFRKHENRTIPWDDHFWQMYVINEQWKEHKGETWKNFRRQRILRLGCNVVILAWSRSWKLHGGEGKEVIAGFTCCSKFSVLYSSLVSASHCLNWPYRTSTIACLTTCPWLAPCVLLKSIPVSQRPLPRVIIWLVGGLIN